MNARRSRIARKAARVVKTETDREFDKALAVLRGTLNEANAAARRTYFAKVDDAHAEMVKAKKAAQETFDEDRAKLLKRLAKTERVAA